MYSDDPRRGKEDFRRSLDLLDDEKERPSLLFQLGTADFLDGDFTSAFSNFEEAKKIAEDGQLEIVKKRIEGFLSSFESEIKSGNNNDGDENKKD